MKLIKANAGKMSEGRYLQATTDKRQAFFLSVVETKRVQNPDTGRWEDGDELWYNAKFEGADADWARDTLQNGDRLLLWGETRQRVREVDGEKYHQTDLFVNSVSFNPHLMRLSVDRTPRQGQNSSPEQGPSFDAAADAEADQTARAEARQELGARLGHVFEAKHITQDTGNAVMDAWDQSSSAAEAKARIEATLDRTGAAPAVKLYLTTVVDQYAGTGRALSWNEAATQATSAAPAHDSNWAQVQQARQDVQSQPIAPSMQGV